MSGDAIVALDEEVHDTIARGHASPGWLIDPDATLDDLREAVETLEETTRIARRTLGGAHPLTVDMEKSLRKSRAVLAAREGDPSARTMLCEALQAM